MSLSKVEMETIINFNEEEKTASVYTHNRVLRRKLDALAQERPEDCQIIRTGRDGLMGDYIVPKSWIRVKPPRVASEAQKAAARAALQKARI